MASLESKLLDGKAAGYCSSSEGEEEDWKVAKDEDQHQSNVMSKFGGSSNTGAKGVLNDYKEFCLQEEYNKKMRSQAILNQAKRGMLMSSKDERERNAVDAELMEEDSLENLRERRLRELRKAARGKMLELTEKDQFTKAIDACTGSLLAVLLYEPNIESCDHLTHVCKMLANDYPHVKFVRVRSSVLGMSDEFKLKAVPALQFYYSGELVGNFIQFQTILGMDYTAHQVKSFLRKKHISLDKGSYVTDSEYSTDEDID